MRVIYVCETCGEQFREESICADHESAHELQDQLVEHNDASNQQLILDAIEEDEEEIFEEDSFREQLKEVRRRQMLLNPLDEPEPRPDREPEQETLRDIVKPQKKRSFPCMKCGRIFGGIAEREWHMREMHPILTAFQTNDRLDLQPFLCKHCPKSYPDDVTLENHLRQHVEEDFLCLTCGNWFRTKQGLTKHVGKCPSTTMDEESSIDDTEDEPYTPAGLPLSLLQLLSAPPGTLTEEQRAAMYQGVRSGYLTPPHARNQVAAMEPSRKIDPTERNESPTSFLTSSTEQQDLKAPGSSTGKPEKQRTKSPNGDNSPIPILTPPENVPMIPEASMPQLMDQSHLQPSATRISPNPANRRPGIVYKVRNFTRNSELPTASTAPKSTPISSRKVYNVRGYTRNSDLPQASEEPRGTSRPVVEPMTLMAPTASGTSSSTEQGAAKRPKQTSLLIALLEAPAEDDVQAAMKRHSLANSTNPMPNVPAPKRQRKSPEVPETELSVGEALFAMRREQLQGSSSASETREERMEHLVDYIQHNLQSDQLNTASSSSTRRSEK